MEITKGLKELEKWCTVEITDHRYNIMRMSQVGREGGEEADLWVILIRCEKETNQGD